MLAGASSHRRCEASRHRVRMGVSITAVVIAATAGKGSITTYIANSSGVDCQGRFDSEATVVTLNHSRQGKVS